MYLPKYIINSKWKCFKKVWLNARNVLLLLASYFDVFIKQLSFDFNWLINQRGRWERRKNKRNIAFWRARKAVKEKTRIIPYFTSAENIIHAYKRGIIQMNQIRYINILNVTFISGLDNFEWRLALTFRLLFLRSCVPAESLLYARRVFCVRKLWKSNLHGGINSILWSKNRSSSLCVMYGPRASANSEQSETADIPY